MTTVNFLKQLPRPIKFAMVGGAAAATHFVSVIGLVEFLSAPPLIANIFGFLIAFILSFSGQRYLTFHDSNHGFLKSIRRFFLIAGSAFVINELLFAIAIKTFGLPYMLSLGLVLVIVAGGTYFASKFWAFRR